MKSVYLISCLAIILSSFGESVSKTELVKYCNDRFGYTSVELVLFSDSTYDFSRWNHMASISDKGTWQKRGKYYILKSRNKTRWDGRSGKSGKAYLFVHDTLELHNDTLRADSTNTRTKRVLFDLEYKLFQCKD